MLVLAYNLFLLFCFIKCSEEKPSGLGVRFCINKSAFRGQCILSVYSIHLIIIRVAPVLFDKVQVNSNR